MKLSWFRKSIASVLVVVGLLSISPACAQITCSAVSMTALNFCTIDPISSQTNASATLNYTCKNGDKNNTHSARLCFSIGEPGGNQTNPRQMASGANKLNFQLYQDAGLSSVWGSSFFGTFLTPYEVTLTLVKSGTTSGSHTMSGQVLNNQTSAVPGSYSDNYLTGDTALTINDAQSTTAPATCDNTTVGNFPFNVSATVSKSCTITAIAGNTLDFGTPAGFLTANVDGTTTITTQCSNGTPYNIGLNNGLHASGTIRRMSGGSAEFISYELYRDSARTLRWGSTVGTDTLTATGNGNNQNAIVYGRVAPQATPSPSSYSDTITVNVTF